MRLEPVNIEQIGSELAIQWKDGTETFLPLRFLRQACPCAACGGEPDVLGDIVRPNVIYTDQSFELRGWNQIGGYALQLTWADGHNTGLYPFDYLRRIDPRDRSEQADESPDQSWTAGVPCRALSRRGDRYSSPPSAVSRTRGARSLFGRESPAGGLARR